MSRFTKESMRTMRSTMLKEMEEVAKKYGVTAHFGNIRFTADDFRVKMEVHRDGVAKSQPVLSPSPNGFTGKVTIGTKIYHPARKDPLTVTNITAQGSVHVTSVRGAKYRLKMSDAIKYAA